eukprot:4591031-Heterocapsa_arctica.AAC.1
MIIVNKVVKDTVKHIELKSKQPAILEDTVLRNNYIVTFGMEESENDMHLTIFKYIIAALLEGMT